jgi:hypothetical protein
LHYAIPPRSDNKWKDICAGILVGSLFALLGFVVWARLNCRKFNFRLKKGGNPFCKIYLKTSVYYLKKIVFRELYGMLSTLTQDIGQSAQTKPIPNPKNYNVKI